MRAVFGEVYPDPVRVISVGTDTSVEFCGGTHLENTKEAEAFTIIEETAVAKGIRRISAVTKDAAKRAIAEGEKFESLILETEALAADTSDVDKTASDLRKDLDAAFLPAALKAELRGRLENIQKKSVEAKKKALQKRMAVVLNDLKTEIESSLVNGKRVIVMNLNILADSKASQQVRNEVKKVAPEVAFLGISEEDPGSGGKLMAFASVPESIIESAGLKANEWVLAALKVCEGRGGGKPDNAQGQAQECSDVGAVLEAATRFAEQKVASEVV